MAKTMAHAVFGDVLISYANKERLSDEEWNGYLAALASMDTKLPRGARPHRGWRPHP